MDFLLLLKNTQIFVRYNSKEIFQILMDYFRMIYLTMIVCYLILEWMFFYGKDQQLVLLKLNLRRKVPRYVWKRMYMQLIPISSVTYPEFRRRRISYGRWASLSMWCISTRRWPHLVKDMRHLPISGSVTLLPLTNLIHFIMSRPRDV
jgi:hypothetical protein